MTLEVINYSPLTLTVSRIVLSRVRLAGRGPPRQNRWGQGRWLHQYVRGTWAANVQTESRNVSKNGE